MKMERLKKVLISGASFAGLTTAYRMNKLGYQVTVVEISNSLKMGGTPVDIKDRTINIVKSMGLYEQIKSQSIGPEKWEFKNADDATVRSVLLKQEDKALSENDFEIERDVLLKMLFDLVKNEVNFIFGNSIKTLQEKDHCMDVSFTNGSHDCFDLVFGCDGIHSIVRKIWFGHELEYNHFLGCYFGIAIVNKLLVDEGTYQMYAEPNKGVSLYAYNKKTDIIFTFRPDAEIPYDFRNQSQQKEIITSQFEKVGWRTAELQKELLHAASFYFDKFCQIKMPSWTKGRVVLVGDAAYCASPAAGMGGSLAIIGAFAMADAFEEHPQDLDSAFAKYNNSLRPFIAQVQTGAINTLDKLLPPTEEAIEMRNLHGFDY